MFDFFKKKKIKYMLFLMQFTLNNFDEIVQDADDIIPYRDSLSRGI